VAVIKKKSVKKKVKSPVSHERERLLFLLKRSIPYFISIGCLIVGLFILRYLFLSIPYFKVKEIQVTGGDRSLQSMKVIEKAEALKMCKGENIFMVNIHELSAGIKDRYPEFKSVKVRRKMPNVLEVNVVPRIPVAMVKTFGYYPIDGEGVILSPEISSNNRLPVISGISIWTRPKIGVRLASGRVDLSLQLLDQLKHYDVIGKFGVQRLEVSNIRNILIFLGTGLEIRMGQDEFEDKLEHLVTILSDDKIDKSNLKYIDLRFKDPVLGTR